MINSQEENGAHVPKFNETLFSQSQSGMRIKQNPCYRYWILDYWLRLAWKPFTRVKVERLCSAVFKVSSCLAVYLFEKCFAPDRTLTFYFSWCEKTSSRATLSICKIDSHFRLCGIRMHRLIRLQQSKYVTDWLLLRYYQIINNNRENRQMMHDTLESSHR